ncbi:MAG: helix-turn-helix domain-containing protein [Bifidobacteriaceae bacterium]|jgi:ATP-dependent DNA helicase RecG|nr:helix-turn-helix domain-containing protein [Bifidobacteriaceae bacterium]
MSLQRSADEAVVRLRDAGTDLADVEVKRASGGIPGSLAESISAFSNGTGGMVILGLDEAARFRPVDADAGRLADGLAGCGRNAIEPAVQAEIDILEVDGSHVVAARIPPGDKLRLPYFVRAQGLESGSYLRSHDGDRHLTSYEVHALVAGRGQPREDSEAVAGATLNDLDPALTADLIGRLRATRGTVFADAEDTDVLRFAQVLARDRSSATPTLAGLLALGRYPQQFFPQLDITFVAFPTTRPGAAMADGTRFLDNASLDGPIPVMISQALAALRRNMTRRAVVQGIGREDHWEYPEEVVRELLGNAVMHRDYHPLARGSQIRVELYPDRLEVISPGGVYGDVPPEALLHEPVSSSRNATLAKLLEDVAYPGTRRTVCENRGTGLLAVADLARRAGLGEPSVASRITEFRVTVRALGGPVDDSAPARRGSGSPDGRSRALSGGKQALVSALSDGPMTSVELAVATGLAVGTVRRYLNELEAVGVVRATAAKKRSPFNAWTLG